MEHRKAQKRMLICAAFFSFGTVCGLMTFLRLSIPAAEQIECISASFFVEKPLIFLPAVLLLLPVILIIFGVSAVGFVLIDLLLSVFGSAVGFSAGILMNASRHGLLFSAFLLVYSLCLIMIGGSVRRISLIVRRQLRSGGLLRQDFGFDTPRIICCLFVILLTALILAYFMLSV